VTPVGGAAQILLRGITGACLAGVYPVGMKIVIGWGTRDRGLLVGLLVGALTVGNALPHLLAFIGGSEWRVTVVAASTLAAVGALRGGRLKVVLKCHRDRPEKTRTLNARRTDVDLRDLRNDVFALYMFLDDRAHQRPRCGDLTSDDYRLRTQAVCEACDAFTKVFSSRGERCLSFLIAAVRQRDQVGDRCSDRAVLVAHQTVVAGDRRTFGRERFPAAFSSARTKFTVRFDAHMSEPAHADL
jgi:hypothetical protein